MKLIGSFSKNRPEWTKDLMYAAIIIISAALFTKKASFEESLNMVLTIFCGFALAYNYYKYIKVVNTAIKTKVIPDVSGKLIYCAVTTIIVTLLFFFYFNDLGKVHVLLVTCFDAGILLVNYNLFGL